MTTIVHPDLNALGEKAPNEHRPNGDIRRPTPSTRTVQSQEELKGIDDLNQAFPWMFEERDELDELSALERIFPWLVFGPGRSGARQDTCHPNLNETDTRLASLSPIETHHFAEVMASMGANG